MMRMMVVMVVMMVMVVMNQMSDGPSFRAFSSDQKYMLHEIIRTSSEVKYGGCVVPTQSAD